VSDKISKLIDRVIWFSYLALAIITPLLFSTKNSELFEVPKMVFVYFAATVILFATLIKFVLAGKILIPKSWPLATFLIFLIFQILSTFASIDKFTSIFGYPSRLNGGLLSQFAYFAILTTALINLNLAKARQLLLAIVTSAVAVSLWGIPAHFGRDPSCLILSGRLTSSCWQKDFDPTLRIFSTLGQPNWLASYLVIVLPLAISFILVFSKNLPKFLLTLISLIIFTALIMTNSRAGLAGLVLSLAIFFFWQRLQALRQNLKYLFILFFGFTVITVIFGTSLFSRIGEALKSDQLPQSTNQKPETSQVSPQTAPTESGQIRLVVWQGALAVFKHWPILGSGPETFAYSYYLFRPASHNQTTEWNFFYNKAHNEFLNYLANVGILGTLAYVAFLFFVIWQLFKISRGKSSEAAVLAKATLSAVVGYQTTIFFGFSTVAGQVVMFLLIASALAFIDKNNLKEIDSHGPKAVVLSSSLKIPFISVLKSRVFSLRIKFGLFKKTAFKIVTVLILAVFGLYLIFGVLRIYFADLLISRAKAIDSAGSLTIYSDAVSIFPVSNPFYLADFAYESAIYAASSDSPQTAKGLATQTDTLAKKALLQSPNNLIIERRVANAYLLISAVDEKYAKVALTTGQKLTQLAPTDPQVYLTLGKIQAGLGKNEEAKKTLTIALNLKPDYQEAKELLEQLAKPTVDN